MAVVQANRKTWNSCDWSLDNRGGSAADGFSGSRLHLGREVSRHPPIIAPRVHLAADLLESVGHVLSLVSIVRQSNEMHAFDVAEASNRSEERRVGKEWR